MSEMVTVGVDVIEKGENLARLDAFRQYVESLGGFVDGVEVTLDRVSKWWHLDIATVIPPEDFPRLNMAALKIFDGAGSVSFDMRGPREVRP